MEIRYKVELMASERKELEDLLLGGKITARKFKRAQILLAADLGATVETIATILNLGTATVYRVKRRFVEEGFEASLHEKPRPGSERKLSGKEEAVLVAMACTAPPSGRSHWTLQLLANKIVELINADSISLETVRRRLKEKDIKPWQHKMWCIPEVDGEYVARMEDVLDLYAEEPDPKRPVVCFDESPTQLIGETRVPVAASPGKPKRIDYEYKRNGTANLFVFFDANNGWRHVDVTERRTKIDFANRMKELSDIHYPDADTIRIVMDNLSTHKPGALYEAFEPEEARRILRRLEFHYTPKHASWLNMVEIEIGVLRGQCLDRRIDSREQLQTEIKAWQTQRNEQRATINWMFDVKKARQKMGRLYPSKSAPPASIKITVKGY
jgi:transposase